MKEGYSVSLREVIGTLRRRWVVVLVGWFVTLVAGWVAIHPTPVYKGITVITLRAPRSENLPNQFNDGRPSIALTGALISARLQSRSGELQLRQAGVVGKYALTPRNSGTSATPAYIIASVEVTNETGSARSALRGIEAIVNTFRSELDVIQADWGVPAELWITVATLAPPSAAPVLVLRAGPCWESPSSALPLRSCWRCGSTSSRRARAHGWASADSLDPAGTSRSDAGWRDANRRRR
jgi:hypothetical protein